MSHELRTPLNAIFGFSSLMRERAASQEQRRDLEIINRSGAHLLDLITDILDLAKIEAGRSLVEIGACDLNGVIHDVASMMRVRAEAKHLTLNVVAPDVIPSVRTDSARLRQILINLLGNAVQYTEQGSISLTLDFTEEAGTENVVLTVEITDTGVGIASEDQARIFQPFVQSSTNNSRKGTGLGLAITKQLLESMAGTIEVESVPGEGSCFRVQLVVKRASESEVVPDADRRERIPVLDSGEQEYRVLVVEDEPENSLLLERLLRTAGFREIQVAANGAQAVRLFEDWRPHFIWMDLRMPVMDGIEATRQIRNLEGGQEVKIADVTASRFSSHRSQVLDAGLDDLVLKPYRAMDIFSVMARNLGVRFNETESPRPPVDQQTKRMQLRPKHLTRLPADLRVELREALLTLNAKRISQVIDRIYERDSNAGRLLRSYADRLAYSAILSAINAALGATGT